MKITRLLAVAALVALIGGTANAFSYPGIPVASGRPDSCSGCLPVTDTFVSTAPIDAFRIPSTGGNQVIAFKVPNEVTGWPMSLVVDKTDPVASPSTDPVCDKVCCGVVMPGAQILLVDYTACTTTVLSNMGNQGEIVQWLPLSITPRDQDGNACTGTSCNGGTMFCSLQRIAAASCAGGVASPDNIDYLWLTPGLQ